ncbi:MAG: GNAT family N-acetyltransferase [Rhizobiaceae bacterium]|nr:GNAT family N-acetyltransferase [Rhizobiaceae bacterium]
MVFAPLETPRLILRSLLQRDLNAVFHILGDKKTTANVSWKQSSIETTAVWLDRRIQNEIELGYSMWGMERKHDKKLVGLCGFFPTNSDDIELGYVVHADYQNRGFATEAAIAATQAVMNSGFSIVATIRPSNITSLKVAEKIGFRTVCQIEYKRGLLLVLRSSQ